MGTDFLADAAVGNEAVLRAFRSSARTAPEDVRSTWLSAPFSQPMIVALTPLGGIKHDGSMLVVGILPRLAPD
jgi:hypothetical protein